MGRPGGLPFLEAPGAGAFRLAGSKRRQDRCYTRSALDASGRDRLAGAEAQAVAAGAAARREGADPGRGLCLRRPATPLRRGRNRRAGVRSRPFRGEPHCAPPPGLQRLRADRPVGPALAPNRARPAGRSSPTTRRSSCRPRENAQRRGSGPMFATSVLGVPAGPVPRPERRAAAIRRRPGIASP